MSDVKIILLLAKIQTLLDVQARSSTFRNIRDLLQGLVDALKMVKGQLRRIESPATCSNDDHARTWVQLVREVVSSVHKVVDEYEIDIAHPRRKYGRLWFLIEWAYRWQAQRHLTANLGEAIAKLKAVLNDAQAFATGTSTRTSSTRRTIEHQLDGKPVVVGLDSPTEKLVSWLVDGDETRLRVISVVGGGGLGKTTLAAQAFHHVRLKGNFQCFAWITVTPTFDTQTMFRSMLVQFYESSDEEAPNNLDYKSLDDLATMLQSFLKDKRYVLVLDDVWSIDVGEFIKFKLPKNKNKSRIVVTTRLVDVAYTCATSYSFVYNHQPLCTSDALELFCSTAQLRTEPDFGQELKDMAREMVVSCSGLPLAVVILAGLISTKGVEKSEWDSVHRKVRSLLHSEAIQSVVRICYDNLPDYLKPCYLYFGMFPENYSIDKTRLIRLWLAEGFIGEVGDHETQEDAAERCLKELIERNLAYASGLDVDGRVRSCAVHGTCHAVILSKLVETNFGAKSDGHHLKLEKENPRLSIQGVVKYSPRKVKAKRLLSLMLFRMNNWPESCMHTIFVRSDILKVLDLTNAPLETFPSEIPTLPRLRYLSLRNTKLKTLPHSIGNLRHLITLDLKGTQIMELPSELLNLENLHHLLAHPRSRSRQGAKISFDLTSFVRLLRLSLIDVSTRTSVVRDIKKLVNLRRLGITNLPTGEGKKFCSSLENLKQLESLSITSKNDELIDLSSDALGSPPPLKRLYFHGPLPNIPNWVKKCDNLAKIRVTLKSLDDGSLVLLGNLQHLKVLKLEEKDQKRENLSFKVGGFAKLKCLYLYYFEKLKQMDIERGAVSSLQKLFMQRCKVLEKLPLGIQFLGKFRELHLLDMPKELDMKPLIEKSEYEEENLILRPHYSHEDSVSVVVVFTSGNTATSTLE